MHMFNLKNYFYFLFLQSAVEFLKYIKFTNCIFIMLLSLFS